MRHAAAAEARLETRAGRLGPTCWRWTAAWAVLLTLSLPRAHPQERLQTKAPCLRYGQAEILLPAAVPGDTISLGHRLVSPESFEIIQDSTLLREGEHYRLDPVEGRIIWLDREPYGGGPLRASYRYLPLALAGVWQRAYGEIAAAETLAAGVGLEVAEASGPGTEPGLPPGARLQVGGSKTFSLEFGNRQDVTLSQSLDLTIRGQLAEQVQVRAILTDRSLPMQPEGTTAELADLDQVLIEVTSPWGELNLGDLTVHEQGFRFLSHQREMEGLRVRAGRSGNRHAGGAFGRGLGREQTLEFFGQTGKQGPYALISPRPGEEVLMVAGSERVWLDGVRLSRGEDADYTVDYSDGEIRFTSRHPITATSEIRVEFRVRRGAFDRAYYWLSASTGEMEPGLAVAWLRERDDPSDSPMLPLDEEERWALSEAGDSATAALEGGVHWVGPGGGPYELVESDTLETPIFLYLGADETGAYLGSYEVVFSEVGEGEGDYRDSTLATGETIYIYAGRRQADYLPGRRLPLPESLDLIALRAGGDLWGGLGVSAEGAFSWHDRNVLSGKDDGDNGGAAMKLQGAWPVAKALGWRTDLVRMHFRYRGVEESFSSPGPLDPAFYSRRWNSCPGILDGKDQRGAVGLRIRPSEGILMDGEWERIEAPKGFSGRRWHLRAERTGRLRALMEAWLGRSRSQGSPGREERGRARLGWSGYVDVQSGYDAEDLRRGPAYQEEGQGHQALFVKIGSGRLLPWLRASLERRLRWDHRWDQGKRGAQGLQSFYETEAAVSGRRGQAHLIYTRSTSEDADGNRLNNSDLADWNLSYKLPRLFSAEWRGKLTAEEMSLLTEKLFYAGAGAGRYDSLGMYVGIGDYELYYAEGDSVDLETRLETALRLSGRPLHPVVPEGSALDGVEISVYGKVKLRTPRGFGGLLGRPHEIMFGDAPTRDHDALARTELKWKGSAGSPTPRLFLEQRRATQRSATGFARERRATRQNMEVRWRVAKRLQGRLELARENERKGIEWSQWQAPGSIEEKTQRHLAAEMRWRFLEPFSARGGGEVGRADFEPSGSRRTFVEAILGAVVDLRRQGRFEVTWERRWLDQGQAGSGAFSLERPGWKLTLNGLMRTGPVFTTSIWLRLEQKEGRSRVITGRMEARAFF